MAAKAAKRNGAGVLIKWGKIRTVEDLLKSHVVGALKGWDIRITRGRHGRRVTIKSPRARAKGKTVARG